jgi:hypothetical protein
MEQNNITNQAEALTKPDTTTNQVGKLSSAVLQRLMEEVKFDSQNNILAYNRTHNRHNRGR